MLTVKILQIYNIQCNCGWGGIRDQYVYILSSKVNTVIDCHPDFHSMAPISFTLESPWGGKYSDTSNATLRVYLTSFSISDRKKCQSRQGYGLLTQDKQWNWLLGSLKREMKSKDIDCNRSLSSSSLLDEQTHTHTRTKQIWLKLHYQIFSFLRISLKIMCLLGSRLKTLQWTYAWAQFQQTI